MLLAKRSHTAGDTTLYHVDYLDWLEEGRTLVAAGCSVSLLTAAVTDVVISGVRATQNKIYFMLAGGSLNETFTLQVQAQDTIGEVVIDTINFTVVPP